MDMHTDKILLDLSDSPELGEFFARRQPGDIVKGRFEAALDEHAENRVILSINDIRLELTRGKDAPKSKGKQGEVAALKVMREEETKEEDLGEE